MALDRIVSLVLRVAELAFAAIVAGVNGEFLHESRADSWTLGRSIYAEVVAGISIFLALIWLIPFSSTFIHWPIDLVISICWWAVFGLLVDQLDGTLCGGAFAWSNVSLRGDPCGKFKAIIAFSFLSALLWLVSALVGFFWVWRKESTARRAEAAHAGRRRGWKRWSYV